MKIKKDDLVIVDLTDCSKEQKNKVAKIMEALTGDNQWPLGWHKVKEATMNCNNCEGVDTPTGIWGFFLKESHEYKENAGAMHYTYDEFIEAAGWVLEPPAEEKFTATVDVGDWVVRDDGKVMKITHDDMPELPYERIARFARWDEIKQLKK